MLRRPPLLASAETLLYEEVLCRKMHESLRNKEISETSYVRILRDAVVVGSLTADDETYRQALLNAHRFWWASAKFGPQGPSMPTEEQVSEMARLCPMGLCLAVQEACRLGAAVYEVEPYLSGYLVSLIAFTEEAEDFLEGTKMFKAPEFRAYLRHPEYWVARKDA